MTIESKIKSLIKAFVPGIAGGIQFWYGEPNPGWTSVEHAVQQKRPMMVAQSAIASLTGLRLKGWGQAKTEFDIVGTLNPIDFRNAPTPKVMMVTRLAIEGIDAVGQFVSKLFKDLLK